MNTHLLPHINNNVVYLPYFLQWLPALCHVNLYFILSTHPQQSFTNADGTPASRDSFLAALANIDAFLIRATYHDQMAFARIADLTLDTAVPENTGQPRAGMVEKCQCPEGYTGLSCEVGSSQSFIYFTYIFRMVLPIFSVWLLTKYLLIYLAFMFLNQEKILGMCPIISL